MKINPETQIIEEAKFKTFGCGSAIASSSLATEWGQEEGKTVEEALAISNTDIVRELSLPPVKIHCSVLAEDATSRPPSPDWKKKKETAAPATTATALPKSSATSCWPKWWRSVAAKPAITADGCASARL